MRRKEGPSIPNGRRPGKGSGMRGYDADDFVNAGWRDFGQAEERPMELVHDPTCDPAKLTPEQQQQMDAQFCMLKDLLTRQVLFTKFPGNVQPPWFARPIIKAKRMTIAANSTGVIFTREIPARSRAIITCLGIDVSPALSMVTGALEFWFSKDNDVIVPIWDDQTTTAYEETDGLTSGKTSVLPGSLEHPFSFLENGIQMIIKGRTVFEFSCENKGDVAVDVHGIMGYYQYWMPHGATEHEQGDVQM